MSLPRGEGRGALEFAERAGESAGEEPETPRFIAQRVRLPPWSADHRWLARAAVRGAARTQRNLRDWEYVTGVSPPYRIG